MRANILMRIGKRRKNDDIYMHRTFEQAACVSDDDNVQKFRILHSGVFNK